MAIEDFMNGALRECAAGNYSGRDGMYLYCCRLIRQSRIWRKDEKSLLGFLG